MSIRARLRRLERRAALNTDVGADNRRRLQEDPAFQAVVEQVLAEWVTQVAARRATDEARDPRTGEIDPDRYRQAFDLHYDRRMRRSREALRVYRSCDNVPHDTESPPCKD